MPKPQREAFWKRGSGPKLGAISLALVAAVGVSLLTATPAKSDFGVDTALDGSACAKGRQRQRGRSIAVTVRVLAGEALTARVRGTVRVNRNYRLGQVKRGVTAGKSRKLRLKPLRKRDTRAIARALRRGKRPLATLEARLSDLAGNKVSRELRVRLSS